MNMHFSDEYVCLMSVSMPKSLVYIYLMLNTLLPLFPFCHDLFATLDEIT